MSEVYRHDKIITLHPTRILVLLTILILMYGKPTPTWSRHLVYTLPWFTLRTTLSRPAWDVTCNFHALHDTGYATYKNCCILGCNIRLSCGRHQRLEETCSLFFQGRSINCSFTKVGSTMFLWNICISEIIKGHNPKDIKFIFTVNIIIDLDLAR